MLHRMVINMTHNQTFGNTLKTQMFAIYDKVVFVCVIEYL